MRSGRSARAAAVLEQLDRQSVSLERLEALTEKAERLLAAGVTHDDIIARRDQINALTGGGVQHDFNDALLLLYDETFAPGSRREEG